MLPVFKDESNKTSMGRLGAWAILAIDAIILLKYTLADPVLIQGAEGLVKDVYVPDIPANVKEAMLWITATLWGLGYTLGKGIGAWRSSNGKNNGK